MTTPEGPTLADIEGEWQRRVEEHLQQSDLRATLVRPVALMVDRTLRAAAALVSVPRLGRYGAALFPGTALVDEEFADLPHNKVLGMEGNLVVATSCLVLLATSIGLARRS